MGKGWLLLLTAVFISAAVNDFSTGHNSVGVFEMIMDVGIGLHLLNRYLMEAE